VRDLRPVPDLEAPPGERVALEALRRHLALGCAFCGQPKADHPAPIADGLGRCVVFSRPV
jgi:hypothetical protein